MVTSFLKIVVIDDNLSQNDPLIVELNLNFSEAQVILKNKASEGIAYILDNLDSKMIVLLDYDLGVNEPKGTQVFSNIREKTSLVFFVIMTAKPLNNIPNSDLIEYINNDALAIINNTDDTAKTINLIRTAVHKLDVRIDCVLEQWINRHSDAEQSVPYITTENDKTYTLKQLLEEIRKQTPLGQEIERNMLMLTIDLLTRGKQKVND